MEINSQIKKTIPTFYIPAMVYDVVLPSEITEKLDKIIFAPKDGVVAKKRKDRVKMLLSDMIHKHHTYHKKHKHNYLKSIPIHRDRWISIAGSRDYYQEIPSLLIANGVIKPYLNHIGEHSYCIGEFSRGYYVPENLMTDNDVRSPLSKPLMTEPDPTEQQQWLVETYKSTEFPSLDEVISESMNQWGKITKKGKCMIPGWVYSQLNESEQEAYTDIDTHIDTYEQLINNGLVEPRYQSNGRMIDSIVTLPSWIRDKMLRIDGEKTVRCDYKSFHHNLIPEIVNNEIRKRNEKSEYDRNRIENRINTIDNTIYTFNVYRNFESIPEHEMQWWMDNCTGDGHTGIARAILQMEGNPNPSAEELKSVRDYVKLESLSHYNTTKFAMTYCIDKPMIEMNRMAKLFNIHCPKLWAVIRDTKKGPYGHCNTSRLLTRLEAKIIQIVIKTLKDENIKCHYAHDCVMIQNSKADRCKEIMDRIVMNMNIPTYSEIDR